MSPADLHITLCRHHSTVQWFITQVHHREQQALGQFFRSSFIVKLIIPQRLTSRHYWTYLKQKEDPLMFIDSSSNILSSVLLPFNWWSGVKWWYKRCIRRTFDQNSRLIRMTFGCLRTKKKKKYHQPMRHCRQFNWTMIIIIRTAGSFSHSQQIYFVWVCCTVSQCPSCPELKVSSCYISIGIVCRNLINCSHLINRNRK